MTLRHKITIQQVNCGECGGLMELTEAARWRCVNPECRLALREFWPRFKMEEVASTEKKIPGVRA